MELMVDSYFYLFEQRGIKAYIRTTCYQVVARQTLLAMYTKLFELVTFLARKRTD